MGAINRLVEYGLVCTCVGSLTPNSLPAQFHLTGLRRRRRRRRVSRSQLSVARQTCGVDA